MLEPVSLAFTGAVLCGGSSRRMGADKALLEVGGRPLVARGRDALVAAGAHEILAVGGDRQRLERLGLPAIGDRYPGAGPLGGIITALESAAHDPVVVVACDLPGVTAESVRALLDGIGDRDADRPAALVAVAHQQGRRHPLLAAYRRAARTPLAEAFARGTRSVIEALATVEVREVPVPAGWVHNVNTPDDLEGVR